MTKKIKGRNRGNGATQRASNKGNSTGFLSELLKRFPPTCALCKEPFTNTRKPRKIAGVDNVGAAGLVSSMYLLCGQCWTRVETEGYGCLHGLWNDAKLSAQTLTTPPGGSA